MKRYYALILALLIVFMTPSAAAPSPERLASAAGDASIGAREETVYIRMNQDGSVEEALAVVRLRVDGAGNYVDYGSFSSVTNLTNGLKPSLTGDGVFWSFPETYPGFAYQCALQDPVLPFELRLGYTLNGLEASPESLAGASGEIGIHVELTRPEAASAYFKEQFMVQLQFTFPADSCEVLEAGGAVPVLAGSSRTLTLACLPGQSLSSDIKLKTTDFSMSQTSVTMTPYDIASIIADNMPELDFTALSDGLDEISKGVDELKSGTQQLKDGSGELASGISASADAAKQLKSSAAQLSSGMAQINTAMEQYETLFTSYITGGDQFIKLFKSLVDGAGKLSSGISQLSAGLDELSANAGKLPDGAQELINGETELAKAFGELQSALDEAVSGLSPEPGEEPEPVSFINGSADITSVQFVGTLPAIKKPAEEKAPPPEEEPSSFWGKLTGLFK